MKNTYNAGVLFLIIIILIALKDRKKTTLQPPVSRPASKAPPSVFCTNKEMTSSDELDAQFGKGRFVGKTGNPFIDDPFFNPWAPGGRFDREQGVERLARSDERSTW